MAMNLRREEYRLQNIRCLKWRELQAECGQTNLITGLFLVLFLAVYLFATLQIARFRAGALYMEDALAASNLASAVIDLEEYGISHTVRIEDPQAAYDRYCNALAGNLNLDGQMRGSENSVIQGKVVIENYTVYNVEDGVVYVHCFTPTGRSNWEELLGRSKSPDGLLIEHTSVYSEISFPVEVVPGVEVTARKGKMADIVGSD